MLGRLMFWTGVARAAGSPEGTRHMRRKGKNVPRLHVDLSSVNHWPSKVSNLDCGLATVMKMSSSPTLA